MATGTRARSWLYLNQKIHRLRKSNMIGTAESYDKRVPLLVLAIRQPGPADRVARKRNLGTVKVLVTRN
jgi:hypothetical protein